MVIRAPRTAPAKNATTARRAAPKKASDRSVAAAVDKLLLSVELDEVGEAKAAIARALAGKLDQAAAPGITAGPLAMATAGIARELREVVDAILESSGDDDGFVADLFS